WVALAANVRHASSTPVSAQFGMYSYDTAGTILASDFGNTKFPVDSNRNSYDSSRYQLGAYQAPDNAVRVRVGVFFRASDASSNPPPNFTAHMDDVDIASTGSKASALASVVEHFDGDTEDGATDNESHYRWTGEPHSSTSEKYLPALNIGESDNWNIIEQYRH